MTPMVKSKIIFVSMLFFSVVVFLQMGLFAAHELWNVELKWNVFQYCLSVMEESSLSHDAAKILLNSLIFYTVGRIAWRCGKQIYLSWKWHSIFDSKKHHKLTKRLNYKYRGWNEEILVVKEDAFIALTMGLLRPRIVISTAVLQLFSAREAEAILQHERCHARNRDPLKVFLSKVMEDGFSYVPVMKALSRYYTTWKELIADRFAIDKMGTEYELGSVLLQLSKLGKVQQSAAGAYFADTAINYRILQVLDPNRSIRVPFLELKPILLSISILLVMTSLVIGGCS